MAQRNVIIVAGGRGLRMEQSQPKQFLIIHKKPIIVHTIEAFLRFDPDILITVVIHRDFLDSWKPLQQKHLPGARIQVAEGGDTRFQSVRSGLCHVQAGLVAIHDAVRPLITPEVIGSAFNHAEKTGSGVVMVPLKDSIRRREGGFTVAEDRSSFFAVQTPQTFQVDLIKQAFEQEEKPTFTDDAAVYEAAGMKVTPVTGDYKNIKITTPEDLLIAETLLTK